MLLNRNRDKFILCYSIETGIKVYFMLLNRNRDKSLFYVIEWKWIKCYFLLFKITFYPFPFNNIK
jgi:hypothetical protein